MSWQPTASTTNLIKRAKIISQVREFFADRGILEVETPILSHYAVTDLHLSSFHTRYLKPGETVTDLIHSEGADHFANKFSLVTSPEYHMKRLLAAGSGSIYQISKCFRNHEEVSRYHNPEFTMLEWYRTQFDMDQMINEVDELLQLILGCKAAERLSYQNAFIDHLNLDPLTANREQLVAAINCLDIGFDTTNIDHDTLLQTLFTFGVEPHIGQERPVAIYNFPATQAALAEINQKDHRVASRFEFYFKGVELANGFKELTNAKEQQARFEHDNQLRVEHGYDQQIIDTKLLAAMAAGLPDCAGVAVGLDRLIMLAISAKSLAEVIAFTFERA
ncbi:elongation factor P--(R)-beta-lysine ligase [Orbaceae bacterium ESL0721]|nr:elongation factor P--(R)-beta-lysine ligase [Orbaceae bacterium ESL0721]